MDIYDEPEQLLGNDGRLGSFPDPPDDGRCILYCDLLCRSLRVFLFVPLWHFCFSRYDIAAVQRRSKV